MSIAITEQAFNNSLKKLNYSANISVKNSVFYAKRTNREKK